MNLGSYVLDQNIWKLSAAELHNLYSKKELSPLELCRTIVNRIEQKNDKVNAFVYTD